VLREGRGIDVVEQDLFIVIDAGHDSQIKGFRNVNELNQKPFPFRTHGAVDDLHIIAEFFDGLAGDVQV
jgi:hypothetical protein